MERGVPKAATIYDVARLAGVSHQTVSRHLAGFEGIRPATRQRVEAAIVELGYRPNLTARSLATARSHRIGALVYEMLEVGPSTVVQGASEAAREAGYLLDIVSLHLGRNHEDAEAIDSAIRLLDQQDLAGIIATVPTDGLRRAVESAPFVVPVVIDAEPDVTDAGAPSSVSSVGTRLLAEHLIGLGHTRILHVSGPEEWVVARNRRSTFRSVVEERGLTPLPAVEGDWSAATGFRAAQRVTPESGITAILADNDQLALGVLRALSERGIRVPEEVSVVGFDDIPESEYFIPPLTTVHVDFPLLGRYAFARVLAMIEGRDAPDFAEYLSVELVIRGSTAPAR
jgi:LacI family transcriptional regulator